MVRKTTFDLPRDAPAHARQRYSRRQSRRTLFRPEWLLRLLGIHCQVFAPSLGLGRISVDHEMRKWSFLRLSLAKEKLVAASLIAALLMYPGTGSAQNISEESLGVAVPTEKPAVGLQGGSFVAAPVPFSNPTIGNGLALGGAWLYKFDQDSKTSSLGAGGFRSDNGSQGYALGAKFNLYSNRYQISALFGKVDLNYDFTAGSFKLPVTQNAELYRLDLAYGFTNEFSLGLGLRYAETTLSTKLASALPPELTKALELEVLKAGVTVDWDRRDDDIFPTSGTRVSLDAFLGEVTGGTGQDYEKAVLTAEAYAKGLSEGHVLALSTTLCMASDSAPFFDSCALGLVDNLRGFSVTEYIGSELASVQAEYRGRIGQGRLGYVAFAGAGWVNETITSEEGLHAAAGVGVRYRLSRSVPMDFSIDATTNSDGDHLYYIYVGQSF